MRFIIGSGHSRIVFDRAPMHSQTWDEQKKGFRMRMNMPQHGNGR